jgi:nitrite reductase (NADH) large subunit
VPAHAKLLAGDLDTETLISYLDRFLMYYIRTADRLQRTAGWIDQLDGGLDRVREVVVDDALGLGAELEAEMARHVGSYFDEWKATLEDPEKLGRFVSFVNSFTEERGQIRPAEPGEPVVLATTIPVGAPVEPALESGGVR